MIPSGSQLLLALPWVGLVLVLPLLMLKRPRLASFEALSGPDAPFVSIIVPARNEAVNISVCLASLLNSLYPNYEIVVVDDDSTDGTADIVRILADHADGRVVVVDGEPLPAGWLGKPWACWQGYHRARGDVLLFTDADTRHEELLLGRAVAALEERAADMVSVMPRQVMIKLWERLILPHIFALISLRFIHLERVNRTRQPRHAIANGQFILIRRDAYEQIGGHEALKAEVVEDQRIAQRLVAAGRRIFIAHAESMMETRMYRSLAGIIEGWTKNLAIGSRSAAPGWAEPAVPWLVAALLVSVWVVPPVILVLCLTTRLGGWVQGWSLAATGASLLFWVIALLLQRVPLQYVLTYPLGALAAAWLFVRSAVRGPKVAWKGRDYRVEPGRRGSSTARNG